MTIRSLPAALRSPGAAIEALAEAGRASLIGISNELAIVDAAGEHPAP